MKPNSLSRLLLAWTSLLALLAAPASAADRKPNVIVILGDDMGYGDVGVHGCKDIPTPHMDSIARNGVRCSSGYVSGPYCSPTRAGLMTGRYQARFGHEFNEGQGTATFGLTLSETTFAQRMQEAGYATGAIGKWHLGSQPQFRPTSRGFDEFYGTLANTPFRNPLLLDSKAGPDPARVEDDKFYTTEAYAARAADFMKRNKDRPFFLYLPFNAVHTPLQAAQKYLDRFPAITDPLRKAMAAEMSAFDDAVGSVLAAVRELKLEEHTLIVFLSDNGGQRGQASDNRPLRDRKATTFEGGIRVPFFVQWKGRLPAGKVFDHPVIQLDILPTALAAAGVTARPEWKLDGVNLLPHLEGKTTAAPHANLYWRFGPQWAIRQGDWKLVAARDPDAQQPGLLQDLKVTAPLLFNLKDDIGESKDLAAANPEKAKALKAAWDAWNKELAPPAWLPQPQAAKKNRKNQ
jgi:arylsulfatase A-like enzyme